MWIIITHHDQNFDDFEDLFWGHRQKMGRLGTADEIANLVLYLSSDEVITRDYQKHNKTLLEPLPESSTQANVITPYEGIWNKHDPLSRLFKVISLTTCPQSSYTTGTCHIIDGGWSI